MPEGDSPNWIEDLEGTDIKEDCERDDGNTDDTDS